MKFYPEEYNVAVTFPFTDLNGEAVVPTAVNAKLYDGDDELLLDMPNLPFEPDLGAKEIIVPAALNILGVGQLSAGRILRVALVTDKGTIRRSFSYVIEGEFRLAIMNNSFQTLESAEMLARDLVNLAGWAGASDEQRYVALIEAYNRLTRIPMKFKTSDAENLRDRSEIFAEDNGLMSMGFEGQQAQQVVHRVIEVGTVAGRRVVGDHPQSLQPHDVIDAQATGMGEVGPQHFDERAKAVAHQTFGGERGNAPALAGTVEDVRWRTHGQ